MRTIFPHFAMFTPRHMAVYWRISRLIRRCRMNTSRASSSPVRAIRLGFAFQTATAMQHAKIKKVTGAAWQSNDGCLGEKLLPDREPYAGFRDDQSSGVFHQRPTKYLSLIESLSSSNMLARLSAPFALGIEGSIIAAKINGKKIRNPLYTRYWSMVPYQLGTGSNRRAMKYSAKPCNQLDNTPQSDQLQDPNYLRTAMKNHLDTDNACFDFLIQTRDTRTAAGSALSVEMATNEWEESAAPFSKSPRSRSPNRILISLSSTNSVRIFRTRPGTQYSNIVRSAGSIESAKWFTSTANLRRSMNAVTPTGTGRQ